MKYLIQNVLHRIRPPNDSAPTDMYYIILVIKTEKNIVLKIY